LNNPSEYVFNFDAIIFGGAMLFLILVIHASYMFFVSSQYEKITDKLIASQRFEMVRLVFFLMAFLLTTSHLFEIFVWGYALSLSGLIPNSHHAMVFAGSAYTTVGFGTNPLPIGWELVMVVIALSGMIAFGWSISVLFGMTQAVNIASQKRKELN
jgi:hypothetical protein